MPLVVYLSREEVPSNIHVIDKNDIFFNGYTNLGESKFEKEVLQQIDKATRSSNVTFIGRTKELGNLNKEHLSTGTKTLLNIYNYPNMCFNVIECGDNALEFLCDINDGMILWEQPFINVERDDETCNIECRGRKFTNICDFLDYDWGDDYDEN